MIKGSIKQGLLAAVFIGVLPVPAIAQDNVKQRAEELSEQARDVQEQADALANDVTQREEAADRDNQRAEDESDAVNLSDGDDDGDGDGGKWGLLGLLGLAGLLGLRRPNTRVHSDVHSDRTRI